MKVLKGLAQYYVDLMMKLGLVRFSLLLASALVVLAIIVQMAVTILLQGQVQSIDLVRSIFWADYYALGGLFSLSGRGAIRRIAPTSFADGG